MTKDTNSKYHNLLFLSVILRGSVLENLLSAANHYIFIQNINFATR